jgi:hypothetical protein
MWFSLILILACVCPGEARAEKLFDFRRLAGKHPPINEPQFVK